jgi:hypothetical protein
MIARSVGRSVGRSIGASGFATGGGGPTFSPSDLTGLELWLDASDSSTVLNSISPDTPATDGQAIRRWLDKSGNDRHAEQTTGANQPLLDADGLNSKGVLTFDGINDRLVLGDILDSVITDASAKFEIYCVAAQGTTHTGTILSKYGDSSQSENERQIIARVASDKVQFVASYDKTSNNITVAAGSTTLVDDDFFIAKFGYDATQAADGAGAGSTARMNFFVNAVEETKSLIAGFGTLSNIDDGTAQLAIGAQSGTTDTSASSFFDGPIAEVLFFSGIQTEENRQKLEGYLAHKWALLAKLPVDHPYKSVAP